MNYQEIELTRITPNPLNPRQRFEGQKFDELVRSIKSKGVIQPVLVRPVDKGFELVAGERRFRASCQAAEANGGLKGQTIPATVRNLTDDEAFELMTIENLQREDLTEFEEAVSFKNYLDKKGEDALPELSERTGISPSYIRRRVKVLDLPKKILASWEKGKLKYGHLEQFIRLEPKAVPDWFKKTLEWEMSVRELKNRINDQSPRLKDAKFDLKAKCLSCHKNTDVQKDLFDLGEVKSLCLDPKCFKQSQNNWLVKNWKKTGHARKFHTNGFRFSEDLGYNEYGVLWKTPRKCRECESFVTLLNLDGSAHHDRACIGDKNCFSQTTREPSPSSSKKEAKTGPRVSWHGEHFREKFFQEQIPLRFQDTNDELVLARLSLLALLDSNSDLHGWFAVRHDLRDARAKAEDSPEDLCWLNLPVDEMVGVVFSLDLGQVREEIKQATLQVVLQTNFTEKGRRKVAEHIGINLAGEWSITREYLQKKTVKEMLEFGEKFGIFADKKAQTFLFETLLKKRGSFKSCKKAELMRVFLESGVELKGKVPEEILNFEA